MLSWNPALHNNTLPSPTSPSLSFLPQVLFAVFDSVQGFVIITVHCAMRREVSPGFPSPPLPLTLTQPRPGRLRSSRASNAAPCSATPITAGSSDRWDLCSQMSR